MKKSIVISGVAAALLTSGVTLSNTVLAGNNPCAAAKPQAMNQTACNPCAAANGKSSDAAMTSGCNPCAADNGSMMSGSCNPCAAKSKDSSAW